MNFHNWNVGEPNGVREDCADVNSVGKWSDSSCVRLKKYVCQRRIIFTDQYQLYFSEDRKSWTEASRECASEDYHLIKIDSASLTSIIVVNSNEPRWIGASDTDDEGQWVWLDGTAAIGGTEEYRQWDTDEPNTGQFGEDCAVVKGDGKWKDVQCARTEKFICQKSLPISVSHNNHLFTFYRTEKVNWDAAKTACTNKGSRLVEIYDEATNNVIKNNILQNDAEFFCGGNINGGTVTWDAGETATYTAGWATGGLNNSQNTKMALSTDGWTDVPSSKHLPYICEMANLTDITLTNKHLVLEVDSDVQANCTANGVPFSKVYWSFSSAKVTTTPGAAVYQKKGKGRSVLHVGKAMLTDEGIYTCVAENQAGNFPITLQEDFTLTVPSVPEIALVEAMNCSSTIIVHWIANPRARNVKYRITVKYAKSESEVYNFHDLTAPIFRFKARKWMMYNITVTPCPNNICKDIYAKFNHTRRRTVGLPGKAVDLRVQLSNKYICRISWEKPSEDPAEYITNYKVTIVGRLHYRPLGSPDAESTNATIINADKTTYSIEGRPNVLHNIGIQPKTCAGFGDIIWSKASCITEAKAPETVEKAQVPKYMKSDGTMQVTIEIPSRENGRISCIFVIVQVQQPGHNVSEYVSANAYTRKDLVRANATNTTNTTNEEYIALALDINNAPGNQLDVTLGDETITTCEISLMARRQKRAAIDNVFVGRNLKLDPYKNNSVLIVTSSPTSDRVLLKASESVRVPKPEVGGTSSGTMIGGVASAGITMMLLLAVIIVVVMKRKRKPEKRTDPPVEPQYASIVDPLYDTALPVNHQYEEPRRDLHHDTAYATVTMNRIETDIPMKDFEMVYNSLLENKGAKFIDQFEDLRQISLDHAPAMEFASNPQLKEKNRYKNILLFDDTRVPIEHNEDGYINACFIHGYENKQKFIATQGPLKETVDDFWMMIVEQNCSEIVMLAKCFEEGKMTCEKYWPDIGEKVMFGEATVSNIYETRSCGFVCRSLKVSMDWKGGDDTKELIVSQFHFLRWPDYGIPVTTSYILQMHQKCMESWKRNGGNSPIVVHSSGGAGRTGAFIGYDIILNEGQSTGNINVYYCVAKMRRQRIEMVHNCDEYILLHKLALESHVFGTTDVLGTNVRKKFSDSQYKNEAIVEQFKNLSRVNPMEMSQKGTSKKISSCERMKIKVYEDGRSVLDVLSPSSMEAYDESCPIDILKEPTLACLNGFWKLVFQDQVSAIVMITEDESDIFEYWKERCDFTVKVESKEIARCATIRKLCVCGIRNIPKNLMHIHLQVDTKNAEAKTAPKIVESVRLIQTELRNSRGAALIHCKNGVGMSGVFCGVMNLLERLKVEDRVDVFRAVKDLRDCKDGVVETVDQFRLCHEAVLEYLSKFDTYSNFK